MLPLPSMLPAPKFQFEATVMSPLLMLVEPVAGVGLTEVDLRPQVQIGRRHGYRGICSDLKHGAAEASRDGMVSNGLLTKFSRVVW